MTELKKNHVRKTGVVMPLAKREPGPEFRVVAETMAVGHVQRLGMCSARPTVPARVGAAGGGSAQPLARRSGLPCSGSCSFTHH